MTRKHKKNLSTTRVLVAVLVGVAAVPATMTGLFRSIDDDGTQVEQSVDLRDTAINDISRVRAARRGYWAAVEMYNELTRLGYTNLTFPNINDAESIGFYLNKKNFVKGETTDEAPLAAAPEEAVDAPEELPTAQEELNALPEIYRRLLEGYVDTGRCPGSLRQYHIAGFYNLCVRLLDEHIDAIRSNLAERSAYLRGIGTLGVPSAWTMKERLIRLEESLLYENGTSVHPRTYEGSRPRIDYRNE